MKDKLDDTTRARLCSSSGMAAGRKILTLLSGHFVVGGFLGVMKFLQCTSFSPTYSPTLRKPIRVHRYGVLCQSPTAITTNNKTTRKNNNSHRCRRWRKETAAAANTKNILAFVRHSNKRRPVMCENIPRCCRQYTWSGWDVVQLPPEDCFGTLTLSLAGKRTEACNNEWELKIMT